MDNRERRQVTESRIKIAGDETYQSFDDNERTLVQFGMLPHDKIMEAESKLLGDLGDDVGKIIDKRDVSRLLAVAVMDAANRGSQKMIV